MTIIIGLSFFENEGVNYVKGNSMVNLSAEEKIALKAGSEAIFVYVDRQQQDPVYKAGGKLISKSTLESLRGKGLVKIEGKNYRITEKGGNEAKEIPS